MRVFPQWLNHLSLWIPILSTLRDYQREWLGRDLLAGLTACIVMIPSVIAYAELVQLPPIAGLYAALAASVGFALFSSSRHVIAGPDAAIGLLAGSIIIPLAAGDPVRLAALAALLAVITGIVLLASARLHLGSIADLLSRPVLVGYLNGASLILASTQLGKLFGIKTSGEDFFPLLIGLWQALPGTHVPTLLFGLGLIVLLVAMERWAPRLPGALAASIIAIVVTIIMGLAEQGIALVGPVPSGMPSVEIPDIHWSDIAALAPAAVAIAFLAFADGVLLAQTFADRNGYDISPNQELVSLGAANLAAGALQGFPVSASQSRSAVVDAAGGQTQLAQLFAAGGLLLFLIFLTDLIALLPRVALGAILIVTAIGMLEVAALRRLWKLDREGFWLALAVTFGILIAGVVPGILLGMALSLIVVLVEISRPRDAVLLFKNSDGKFHDLDRDDPEGTAIPGLLVYRLYAPLIFANSRYVMARIRQLVSEASPSVRWLIIDAQAITDMDVTAAERFADLHEELSQAGIAVKIADTPRPFREELERLGLSEEVGREDFYISVKKAVEAYQQNEHSCHI